MSLKNKIFNTLTDRLLGAIGINRPGARMSKFLGKLNPVFEIELSGKKCKFYCPNDLIYWRAVTFWTKEPETLQWIDSFNPGDTLFDVGANIGLYTIYAGLRGIRVMAFEPQALNYNILNRNVYLNDLGAEVTCLNLAIADKKKFGHLYISEFVEGGALNNFGGSKDWNKKEFRPDFKQGMLAYSLDEFVKENPGMVPQHIKIDVDGIEDLIIKGAMKLLKHRKVRSVLIEINEELKEHLKIIEILKESGFKVKSRNQSELFETSDFKHCFNYIFKK